MWQLVAALLRSELYSVTWRLVEDLDCENCLLLEAKVLVLMLLQAGPIYLQEDTDAG